MRSRSHRSRVCLGDRPFQGSTVGSSLYVGTPDAASIRYRRNKSVGQVPWFTMSKVLIDIGADSIPRTLRVAHTTSPTGELTYSLPAGLIGVPVACQVRTFADDYENDTIYRPRLVSSDDGGNDNTSILGVAAVVSVTKLDEGGMRVQFIYTANRNGLQPETFSLVKASGPGTLPIAQVDYFDRDYSIDVAGLTDAAVYTFDLVAHSGPVDATLIEGIEFTADAAGPGSIANLTAEEY